MSRSCWAGAVERRVGRGTRKEWLLAFALAFRSWPLNIRRNTRSTAIAPYGPGKEWLLLLVFRFFNILGISAPLKLNNIRIMVFSIATKIGMIWKKPFFTIPINITCCGFGWIVNNLANCIYTILRIKKLNNAIMNTNIYPITGFNNGVLNHG